MDSHDFAANSLNFSGTLTTCILAKIYYFRQKKAGLKRIQRALLHTLSEDGQTVSKALVIHAAVRGFLFIMNTLLIIKAGYYSMEAGIAFGVISSIFSLAAVLNTLIARFYFKEYLSWAKYLGIAIILAGVVWISLLKNNSNTQNSSLNTEEQNYEYYQTMAVVSAVVVAI